MAEECKGELIKRPKKENPTPEDVRLCFTLRFSGAALLRPLQGLGNAFIIVSVRNLDGVLDCSDINQ